MTKIYIAGPVTNDPDYMQKFERAAEMLADEGYEPVSPVAPGLVDGWEYRDYINRGLRMLMDCDGICLLPGYKDSKGTLVEIRYATLCELQFMYIVQILDEWRIMQE
jgi:nucleoside 2-deoxyribosyltransferase